MLKNRIFLDAIDSFVVISLGDLLIFRNMVEEHGKHVELELGKFWEN